MKKKIIVTCAVVATGGLGYLAYRAWKHRKAASFRTGPASPGFLPGPAPVIPASLPATPEGRTVARPVTQPATAKSAPKFPLKMGSKGPEVALIQKFLNQQHNAGLKVDGDWGTKTELALKAAGQPTLISESAWAVAEFAINSTNLSGFSNPKRII